MTTAACASTTSSASSSALTMTGGSTTRRGRFDEPSSMVEGALRPKKFTWILWTLREQTAPISDEFIADGFRVVLMGNTLELFFEAPGTTSYDAARALAQKYVTVLGTNLAAPITLISEEEFLKRTTP